MRRWTAAPLTFTLTETSAALGTRPSIGAVAVCGCEGGAYCSCAVRNSKAYSPVTKCGRSSAAQRVVHQPIVHAAGHPLHSVLHMSMKLMSGRELK